MILREFTTFFLVTGLVCIGYGYWIYKYSTFEGSTLIGGTLFILGLALFSLHFVSLY